MGIYNRLVSLLKKNKSYSKRAGLFLRSGKKKAYIAWIQENEPDNQTIEEQRHESSKLDYRPKISVIVPVYNPDTGMLESMIRAVTSQTYDNWELCIADGSSKNEIRNLLLKYSEDNERIKLVLLPENKHISGNSNEALALATGEFVAFLDQDDELSPNALYEVALLLNKDTGLDVIYSDEDKIDLNGARCSPYFKPDWSPDLLLSVNYICHLSVIRSSLVKDIGGFRVGYEGAQDYDLILRATGKTDRISHIPKVLYHWRMHRDSTSIDVGTKTYSHQAGENALKDFLSDNGVRAEVQQGFGRTNYRVKYIIDGKPLVSIIIPFRDKLDLLKNCVNSILQKTGYSNYEIILVSNRSREEETRSFIDLLLDGHSNIRFFEFNEEFNFSRINNFAAKECSGEYLLFLNNDTEVLSPGWIEALLEHAQRKEIGFVGCKLLFPDNTIQHAGVTVGMTGFAGHVFSGLPEHSYTFFGSSDFARNVLALTGACMMIKRGLFNALDGFNEEFVLCGSDVDICLRAREAGHRNIYTPYAVLYHHESASRKKCQIPRNDFRLSLASYREFMENGDPYYSPNLSLLKTDCSLISEKEKDVLKETVINALG
jgi:GT2 family glycosyltransferase